MDAAINRKNRIPIFIQARMNSSRLPGKMSMKMKNGKTLLENVILRCQMCKTTDRLIILTSSEPSDSKIVKLCKKNAVDVFEGSLENVYERYMGYIIEHNVEAFVRICGDSPLISHRLIDYSIDLFQSKNADLVSNICRKTFPSGQSVEVVSTQFLVSMQHLQSKNFSQEHITQGLYELSGRIFSVEKSSPSHLLKLSVDTLQDFNRVDGLINLHKSDHFEPDIKSIFYHQKI